MINVDAVKNLIDQIPEIKNLFKTENLAMFSSYDRNTGKRKKSSVEYKMIYKQPEFLEWKERLYFELNKIQGDEYIDEIMKLLTKFRGFDDDILFEKLESKLKVLREHLEEYMDN